MKTKTSKKTTKATATLTQDSPESDVLQSSQPNSPAPTPVEDAPPAKHPKSGTTQKKSGATGAAKSKTRKTKSADAGIQEDSATPKTKSAQTRPAIAHKQVCNLVYDVFPELDVLWAVNPTKDNPTFKQKLDDISVVLRYFATHPRILESIRTGMLS